jgi:predicted Zn-dependent protease with MMP-like domain
LGSAGIFFAVRVASRARSAPAEARADPDLTHGEPVPALNPAMKFEQFEQRATDLWQQIPPEYRAGVDGVRVEREARAHPDLPDVYTLGECLTESYPSDFGGPDTTRSLVVLYYGSFWRLSRLDEEFDWEEELWETLTHELQHHLESLAADDTLEDVDYAADENFKRLEGRAFDPFFFRAGERLAGGWYRVEGEHFREFESGARELEFEWSGERYRVGVPQSRADVLFLEVESREPLPAGLVLAVVRPSGMLRVLRSLFTSERRSVEEYEVSAEPLAHD